MFVFQRGVRVRVRLEVRTEAMKQGLNKVGEKGFRRHAEQYVDGTSGKWR